ncbi:hypothetical protein CK203_016103 [Vitis vinifera]|uniref:Integrase catalytic domain-containing protein n=1 Tax=Vitis vinifera TaxID=29760 RepID=A0A438JN14_VITVI|nr:hypothetical protein CK203_016103 [Vitis vinifera]
MHVELHLARFSYYQHKQMEVVFPVDMRLPFSMLQNVLTISYDENLNPSLRQFGGRLLGDDEGPLLLRLMTSAVKEAGLMGMERWRYGSEIKWVQWVWKKGSGELARTWGQSLDQGCMLGDRWPQPDLDQEENHLDQEEKATRRERNFLASLDRSSVLFSNYLSRRTQCTRDSGASDHLFGNKDLFLYYTTSDLPTVTLANGSQLWLKDRSTGKTIGIGRESQGLYHLTSDSSPAVYIPLMLLSSFTIVWATLVSPSSRKMRLNNRAKSPFELVHTDVWGPCRTASTLGFQYFVTFIDDYSRLTCQGIFFSPIYFVYVSSWILHQSSYAHTPQQNGVAERKNRHLVETARQVFRQSHEVPLLGIFQTSEGLSCYSLRLIVLPIPIVSPPDAMPPRPLQVFIVALVSLLLSLFLRHLLTHFLSFGFTCPDSAFS